MTDPQQGLRAGGDALPALSAGAIAHAVGGALRGDPARVVTAVAPLDRAGATDVSFLAAAQYAGAARATRAGVVLATPALAEALPPDCAVIAVEAPQEAMLALLPRLYRAPAVRRGVHPTAVVADDAALGEDVAIGPYAVVESGATIGDRAVLDAHVTVGERAAVGADAHLYPGVAVYANSVVGDRVILHAGVRVGSDGFGYVYRDGAHRKIPHVGRCVIEQDVEIGANSTIDRGSVDDTVIGAGTKIDNLVHIAHNVRIGRLCLLMAQVGVAGSVRIEDGAILAGQVGVSGHHTIGRGARLAAQAGVFGDIPAGETWSGYPARPHREALRAQAALFKLPAIMRRLERLVASADERG